MNTEERAIGVKRIERGLCNPVLEKESGIKSERGVAFRQDKPIPFRIVRPRHAQTIAIEACNNVGDRECTSNMADIRALGLLQNNLSNLLGEHAGYGELLSAKNGHVV